MAKTNNKGFSLVEVIIAVAIFAILIIPLTTQLISAVKTNKKTTQKQYAVEMAEELMESFKVCELNDTIMISNGDASSTTQYEFTKSATSETKTVTLPGGSVDYTIDTYSCNDVAIGTNFETYSCEVTVSDAPYKVSSKGYVYDKENDTYKKNKNGNAITTKPATGTIRNLDNKQVAIISGATYTGQGSGVEGNNLDNQASAYFKDTKLDILKDNDVYYSQYLSGQDYFKNDMFDKYTTISIKKDGSKYLIEGSVRYVDKTNIGFVATEYKKNDKNVFLPVAEYGNGIVYSQSYDELPPIYLLYAPAICNGQYCPNDYINIEIDNSIKTEGLVPKVYLFETASDINENYKDIICDQFGVTNLNQLVYKSSFTTTQKQVNVRVSLEKGDLDKVKVYSNFPTYKKKASTEDNKVIDVMDISEDDNDSIYLYDISITLTDSEGHKTTIEGTRGN